MDKFTTGPWTYEYDNDTLNNDEYFCEWYGMPGVFKADREEDAQLIAQAPALLADLRLAAETLRHYEVLHRQKNTEDSVAKAKLNAALAARFEATIAKATGAV